MRHGRTARRRQQEFVAVWMAQRRVHSAAQGQPCCNAKLLALEACAKSRRDWTQLTPIELKQNWHQQTRRRQQQRRPPADPSLFSASSRKRDRLCTRLDRLRSFLASTCCTRSTRKVEGGGITRIGRQRWLN